MSDMKNLRAIVEENSAMPDAEDHVRLLSKIPPLVPGDWLTLDPATARRILEDLPEELGRPTRTALRVRALPFFPDWLLLESVERCRYPGPQVRSALLGKDRVVLLDGDMAEVHSVREAVFRRGGPAQTLDYLRFFTTVCRSPKGRFHIVISLDDLSPDEAIAPTALDIVHAAMLEPIRLEETPEGWSVQVRLIHGADLCDAEFLVPPDGACEMVEDIMLVENALCRTEQWDGPVLTVRARQAGKADD